MRNKALLLLPLLTLIFCGLAFYRVQRDPRMQSLVPPCFTIGPPMHHSYRPGCEGDFFTTRGQPVRYRFNSRGLRADDERTSGTDLLLIGDSNVEGHGLEFSETIGERLAKLGAGRVVNGGIRYSGPLLQRLRIESLVPAYRPRRLLWMFCENDTLDDRLFSSLATARTEAGLPTAFSTDDFRGTDFYWPAWLDFDPFRTLTRVVRNAIYIRRTDALTSGVTFREAKTCEAVEAGVAFARARGVEVAFAAVPLGPFRGFPPERYGFEELVECAKKIGPTVDLRQALANTPEYFLAGDTHPNPAGAAFIAAEIRRQLPQLFRR